MSFIVFVLHLLVLPVVVLASLLFAAVLVVVRMSVFFTGVCSKVGRRLSREVLPRWMLPVGLLMVALAYTFLLWYIRAELHSPGVIIGAVFGGVGFVMAITSWLTGLFAPPLSQAKFEQAMAEQTEVIGVGNAAVVDAVKTGNAEVVAVLSELIAQISELSDEIRALIEARAGEAGSPVRPGDAQD